MLLTKNTIRGRPRGRESSKFKSSIIFSLSFQSDLVDQKSVAETYRAQLLAVEAEMELLREQSLANKESLKVI